jgi:uncharacterized protein (TIGR02147 family)
MTPMNYRELLANELEKRLAKNPQYSVRAFARDLDISKTHLAEILRGKNQLSVELADKFTKKLNFDRAEAENFLDLVEAESGASTLLKTRAQKRLEARFLDLKNLEPEEFSPISEWYFMPLMELLTLPLASHSPEHLAARLGIPAETVALALEILLRQKLIARDGAKYTVTQNTTQPVPSQIIRKYYHKNFEVAAQALETQDIDQRDFSVITFTLSKQKLKLAKDRIQQFRRELALELTQDPEKDAVYTLAINFFEATLGKETP